MELFNECTKLYKRNIIGNIIVWWINIDKSIDKSGNDQYRLVFHHGKLDGRISKHYSDPIVPKSRSTAYAQAVAQMNATFAHHQKQGYKSAMDLGLTDIDSTVEFYNRLNYVLPKFNTDANNCIKPMKCQKFSIGKFTYPAIIQPKINGVRCVIMLEPFTPTDMFDDRGIQTDKGLQKVVMKTKEGLEYKCRYIENVFKDLYTKFPKYQNIVFDGEIYIKDEKVTSIGGAARNTSNPLHGKLQFVNFDLSIDDMSNAERDILRYAIWNDYIGACDSRYKLPVLTVLNPESHNTFDDYRVVVLNSDTTYSDSYSLEYMQRCIDCGFEGAVIRNPNTTYQFGSRPQTMMKLKKFEDAEFECYDYKWSGDPNQGVGFSVVLLCKNDINDLTFESTVVGTVEERKAILDNPPIGKVVTIKFYERTKNGIPFHSNVIAIRDYE